MHSANTPWQVTGTVGDATKVVLSPSTLNFTLATDTTSPVQDFQLRGVDDLSNITGYKISFFSGTTAFLMFGSSLTVWHRVPYFGYPGAGRHHQRRSRAGIRAQHYGVHGQVLLSQQPHVGCEEQQPNQA